MITKYLARVWIVEIPGKRTSENASRITPIPSSSTTPGGLEQIENRHHAVAVLSRSGLKQAGRAGRKPRLNRAQLKQIEHALKRGPEALGYATGVWTASRVRELIEERCGVRYHKLTSGASCACVWRIAEFCGNQ